MKEEMIDLNSKRKVGINWEMGGRDFRQIE